MNSMLNQAMTTKKAAVFAIIIFFACKRQYTAPKNILSIVTTVIKILHIIRVGIATSANVKGSVLPIPPSASIINGIIGADKISLPNRPCSRLIPIGTINSKAIKVYIAM